MLKLREELKDYYFGIIFSTTILFLIICLAKGKFYFEAFILQVIFYGLYFIAYKPIKAYLIKKKKGSFD